MQAIVYGWRGCGHCERARELLELHGVDARMEYCEDRRALFERIQRQYGRATAPVVLLDGELVGGLPELQRLARDGALGPALGSSLGPSLGEGTESDDAR